MRQIAIVPSTTSGQPQKNAGPDAANDNPKSVNRPALAPTPEYVIAKLANPDSVRSSLL